MTARLFARRAPWMRRALHLGAGVKKGPHRAAATLTLCATLLGVALPAGAAPLDDMQRFVEASQFEQAMRVAQANPQLIGDVHFDFLYGVAAINVGRVAEGLLALERHLAGVPANDRARLELARGYFLIGEYARARSEFEFVLRYNPPANTRATIMSFLQSMQLGDLRGRDAGGSRLYAEAGVGHDSNVNNATFRDEVLVGASTFNLTGTSKALPDTFGQVSLGAQRQLQVTNRLSVFAGVDVDHKENARHTDFNLTSFNGNIGFTNLAAFGPVRLTLNGQVLLLGSNRYRDRLQIAAEATTLASSQWQIQLFGQYSDMRYGGSLENLDARSTGFGAQFTFDAQNASLLTAGLRVGYTQEDNLRSRPDLSRQTPLVRVFAAFAPAEGWRVSAGLTAYYEDYQAPDIGFQTERRDKAGVVDLVVSRSFTPQWSARLELTASEVRSNQNLYDSRRVSASLKARYQY